MSNSRWAQASREELEELEELAENYCAKGSQHSDTYQTAQRLQASCPPLRTRAEVAEDVLTILQRLNGWLDSDDIHHLHTLAKERTRG